MTCLMVPSLEYRFVVKRHTSDPNRQVTSCFSGLQISRTKIILFLWTIPVTDYLGHVHRLEGVASLRPSLVTRLYGDKRKHTHSLMIEQDQGQVRLSGKLAGDLVSGLGFSFSPSDVCSSTVGFGLIP